jgi:hypothetical protein
MNRDERMHLTLKKEATKPPALDFLQQQARFDEFIEPFNNERPHFHDKIIVVTNADASAWGTKKLASARSLSARLSASKKFTMTSGWLALWIMIWGTSILRLECSNRLKTRSARDCYLCSRYIL